MKTPLADRRLAKAGEILTVDVNDSGQATEVRVTKEMLEDLETAFAYAAAAARGRMEASLKLSVAIALYAGENLHAPWAVQGYWSFHEAIKYEFELSKSTIYNHRKIGRTLIEHFGKKNVIEKARATGITNIAHTKLRQLVRVPLKLEELLTYGHVSAPDGSWFTVDDVAKMGVRQFPVFINRMADEPKTYSKLSKADVLNSIETPPEKPQVKRMVKFQAIIREQGEARRVEVELDDRALRKIAGALEKVEKE